MNSDQQLQYWQDACQGDRQAQAVLLREVQDLIYRFCVSQLGPDMAAEATQETALRVLQCWQRFSGQGRFSTWVLGIALNVCREFRRKQQNWQTVKDSRANDPIVGVRTSSPDVGELLEAQEDVAALESAIRELPDRQREAVVLRHLEQLSINEVAEAMGVSPGTVKATLNQALRNLDKKLTGWRES